MPKVLLENNRTTRFKVIKAVYEKLTVQEGTEHYVSKTISDAQTVFAMFSFLQQETKEHFIALHLDVKNRILCIDRVSAGTMTGSLIHPREVFKTALLSLAASVLLIHNHPSGDPTPSRDDISITEKLKGAGELIGIAVLDHVIIGDGYVSLKEKGYL
ncbi:MAG: DNA repair protein RadC [Nitrospirae bacterium]|nr:DNA repair protein RadC [Nitrospirota bacterium]